VVHRLFGPDTRVVNSATVVAKTVQSKLAELGLLAQSARSEHQFFATDVSERSQTVAQRFWSQKHGKPPHFDHVDLPNIV
jgi:glutamate racemase